MVDTPALSPGDRTVATVKSKYLSKTNITAVLLVLFGAATAFGALPDTLSTPEAVGSIVSAGGVLVVFFRTLTKNILA
jgi:hypothetical protein